MDADLPKPYQVLSQIFDFQTKDEEQWWHSTAPMLAAMMHNAHYDIHQQYEYLCLHREHIVPALGRYPRNETETSRWKSMLTRHGLPFELSLNCSECPLVRFALEPTGPLTGSQHDRFNTKEIHRLVEKLARHLPSLDLQWFQHFVRDIVISDYEAKALAGNHLPVGAYFTTQNKLAFDLTRSGHIVVKTYLYPQAKAAVTGIPAEKLMFDAIRNVDHDHSLSPSLSVLEEYLVSRRETPSDPAAAHSLNIYFLSFDLVDPSRSRIKIYAAEQLLTFAQIEHLWTLGGRRTSDPETTAGLGPLKELWQLLQISEGPRDIPNGFYELDGPAPDEEPERLPAMVNFGLYPGRAMPEIQIYIPTVGENDLAIADALTVFFARQGWTQMAESYKRDLCSYYPDLDLARTTHIQACVSYSYREGIGPYLSVYTHSFETLGVFRK